MAEVMGTQVWSTSFSGVVTHLDKEIAQARRDLRERDSAIRYHNDMRGIEIEKLNELEQEKKEKIAEAEQKEEKSTSEKAE